jgi:hypothetical protein
MMSLEDAVDDY